MHQIFQNINTCKTKMSLAYSAMCAIGNKVLDRSSTRLAGQLMGADEDSHIVCLLWSCAVAPDKKVRCVRIRHKRRAHDQAVSSVAPLVNQRALLHILLFSFFFFLFSFLSSPASAMTLSGTLYSDEGVSTITSGKTITIAVGTTTTSIHSATSNGSGVWTFNLGVAVVVGTSTPILIWVDGDTSTRASLFTKVANSLNDITGLDLYQNRVVISHEGTSGTSTTISNMSFYDSDNDNDIQYNAATTTNTLTVFSNQELHVKTGKTFAPGGNVTINGNASTTSPTDGNFHISDTATYTAGGLTTVGGNFMASSSAVFTPDRYATIMNASTTGKVVYPLTTSLGNMLFTGLSGSTYSFANSATTSDFYIATNATVTAPTLLTIAGNYVNVGGFVHNSGTVRMASTSSHFISGNTATSSAFNGLTIDGAGAVSFAELLQIATDTPASHLYPITIDQTNGVLYTGTGNSGVIYRCVLSTGCDSIGDYTTATDTPATTIYSLVVDSVNGTLYAGTDLGGIIYRCALSTGCDSAGDFTNATDTAETIIYSLAVDSVNGTLYAGTNPGGIIYRCALSTGCASPTDFTVATDTAEAVIYSLTVDSVNGTLYAGTNPGGMIFRCALSTGCNSAGNFTTAYDTVESTIYSLTVDSINGTLYAGSQNGGIIFRCALSTGCNSAGNFTTAYDTPNARVSALAVDSINGILFSSSDNGIIYRCALSTLCDSSGDFSVATDTPEGVIYSLVIDDSNGTLYAALNTTGIVFKCILCNGTYSSTTANANLTIETGASFTSNREMRMSGNYVNNGTSSPNTSVSTPTLVFTGSSAQTLSGTLTATSSLPYTTFIGSGTKTLSSNASTTGDVVIGSGSTVSLSASTALSLRRNLESNGTINNSGTMYFTALGSSASGTLTGAGALGNVSIQSTQDLFTVATDTGETKITSLALDRTNQVLYAGTALSGLIFRCALSTNCDSITDFTVATDTAETFIHGMIVDPVNQVLYAGSGSSGAIYRCALSTGCDSVTDFTLPFASTSVSTVRAFTIDTTNQVLYAGTGSGGIILRCVLSTGCDAATEFTQAADTTTSIVYDLGFDATNGVLYLATGGTGIVLRCVVSTSCASLADFTTATDTPETTMYSIAIDRVNNVLYTGSGNNGRLFRCVLSTGCTGASDFALALDGSPQVIRSLTIDTTNNILYVGSQAQGAYIYRCILSTGCDADSDFTTYYDTKEDAVYNLVFNDVDNTVYGATGDTNGYIFRRANGITFSANASTSNLTIGTSTTLVAPAFLSVAGSYTNNGTYLAGGTTTFSGASAQTLAGTMVATSSFNHVAFSGAGTKAFSSNASTSNFRIESGSGAVTAPSFLTIAGNYNNAGTFTANSGTTTFSSTTAQSITGIATGTSAFSTLILTGTSTKTFASNASTTNVIIQNGATVVLPPLFSLTGNYINNGTTTAGTGTTTFNGTTGQVASGTMTGTSAFNNLAITNTSGAGSSSQSIRFLASASTSDTFTMSASTSVQFLAGATSTFQNISLNGASGQNVFLRSSTPNTSYGFYVPGTQKTVSYVDVRDSSACPTIMLATDGTNVNSGNNTCWSFAAAYATVVSNAHQVFAYLQATSTINPITITDNASSPSITTANDIRLIIATSTTNMRWDTTDTTATFGGTASGKVAGTVSYLGNGTILVIDVTSDFSAGDTLTISDLSYARFETVSPASVALGVRTAGVGTTTNNSDSKTVTITGTIAIGSHTSGQIDNAFTSRTVSGGELLAFKLTPAGETFAITNLAFPLKGVQGIVTSELTNVSLYRDMNANQVYDAGDVAVGGAGSVSISGQTGTLTFSQSFSATTTQDYLLIGDAAELSPTDALVLALSSASMTTTGSTSLVEIVESGGVDDVQHIRGGGGGGGGGGGNAIGGNAPAGDGIRTGGGGGGGDDAGSNGGTTIGNEVGFNPPSSNSGSWTTGGNGYNSDGAYATANSSVSHTYGSFGFTVPNNNQITGIVVKLEASGSTAAGTISVRLSWDGGPSVTSLVTTGTLTTSDAVYELGSPSDTWGHSWLASEFNNGNFTLEVVANPSGNTVKIDAIQVRVYHQATGGSGGGGGAVFKEPSRYFANVYSAFGGAVATGIRSLFGWFNGE